CHCAYYPLRQLLAFFSKPQTFLPRKHFGKYICHPGNELHPPDLVILTGQFFTQRRSANARGTFSTELNQLIETNSRDLLDNFLVDRLLRVDIACERLDISYIFYVYGQLRVWQ